ncbi:hypothetical protein [Candidatus Binatus soli]|jgi:hypothetical protein|uniref:hypothetical protein n=1 Tax=Candidatus Binatus soli TaxID=1953413 RepID=UPI003D148779
MTKQEAIDTLDGLQKAFKALNQTKAMQAFNVLLDSGGVVTTAFNLGIQFASALTTLKTVFDAIEEKGIHFPPN